ncbi:hypothetical protein GCM10007094_33500 [Pseudovibrio japonicus]|uniref:Uncharacterized protein n=1 Tax=Pseudovibrio japonicus TaxID=366534 RepID=A0ABQ3EM41_9HYPH|nr:hypothetical protein GCM10007094_33500 [Pseudovibrio japonicus]
MVGLDGLLPAGAGKVCIKGEKIGPMRGACAFSAMTAVAKVEALESALNFELNGPAQAGALMCFTHNNDSLEGREIGWDCSVAVPFLRCKT